MEANRMVIIHNPGSDNTTISNNNPQADKGDQIQMLRAHISYFLRNMVANGVPYSEVTTAAKHAVRNEISILVKEWMTSDEHGG